MYQLLGGARNNNDSEDDSALEENLLKLKNYTYFDGDKILSFFLFLFLIFRKHAV